MLSFCLIQQDVHTEMEQDPRFRGLQCGSHLRWLQEQQATRLVGASTEFDSLPRDCILLYCNIHLSLSRYQGGTRQKDQALLIYVSQELVPHLIQSWYSIQQLWNWETLTWLNRLRRLRFTATCPMSHRRMWQSQGKAPDLRLTE